MNVNSALGILRGQHNGFLPSIFRRTFVLLTSLEGSIPDTSLSSLPSPSPSTSEEKASNSEGELGPEFSVGLAFVRATASPEKKAQMAMSVNTQSQSDRSTGEGLIRPITTMEMDDASEPSFSCVTDAVLSAEADEAVKAASTQELSSKEDARLQWASAVLSLLLAIVQQHNNEGGTGSHLLSECGVVHALLNVISAQEESSRLKKRRSDRLSLVLSQAVQILDVIIAPNVGQSVGLFHALNGTEMVVKRLQAEVQAHLKPIKAAQAALAHTSESQKITKSTSESEKEPKRQRSSRGKAQKQTLLAESPTEGWSIQIPVLDSEQSMLSSSSSSSSSSMSPSKQGSSTDILSKAISTAFDADPDGAIPSETDQWFIVKLIVLLGVSFSTTGSTGGEPQLRDGTLSAALTDILDVCRVPVEVSFDSLPSERTSDLVYNGMVRPRKAEVITL